MEHPSHPVESHWRTSLRNRIIQASSLLEVLLSGLVLIPFLAVIFLACLLPTGMVSLGSVTMAALYPVLTILYGVFRGYSAADLTVCAIGSVIMGAMVIYMHRSNIQRIREGKEYRFGRHGKKQDK